MARLLCYLDAFSSRKRLSLTENNQFDGFATMASGGTLAASSEETVKTSTLNMAIEFFQIIYHTGKAQIKIDTKVDYEFGYVLDSNTNLIHENEFYVDQGKNWFDIVRFQDIPNFAISQKVKKLFEENNVTGWSCFPIVIKDHNDKSYYGFQILSKAGKILNLKNLDNYIDKFVEFDINTWNGSEIFTLEDTGITACTGKVKELCENAKITNIKFERL